MARKGFRATSEYTRHPLHFGAKMETIFATLGTPELSQLVESAKANIESARPWYRLASEEIRTICLIENWRIDKFTAILAVTSPRCAVRRNVRNTLQYMANGQLLANTMRSVRRSVEIWEASGEILGPKTSAFYAALMGDENAVVLDTHMAGLFAVDQKTAFKRKRELAHWCRVVRHIAKLIGESARDTQASLWYSRKLAIGENPELFPIALEYRNFVRHGRVFPQGKIDSLAS